MDCNYTIARAVGCMLRLYQVTFPNIDGLVTSEVWESSQWKQQKCGAYSTRIAPASHPPRQDRRAASKSTSKKTTQQQRSCSPPAVGQRVGSICRLATTQSNALGKRGRAVPNGPRESGSAFNKATVFSGGGVTILTTRRTALILREVTPSKVKIGIWSSRYEGSAIR